MSEFASRPTSLAATERPSARFAELEAWPAADILEALWDGQMAAVAAVRAALASIERAAAASLPRLRGRGRLVYAGAGTSGRIAAADGAELPPTFDWPSGRVVVLVAGGPAALTQAIENAEDRADRAEADVTGCRVGPEDVLLALAASGATPYTLACVRAARQAGALTIGLANSPGAPLLAAAEHPILLDTGAEVLAGSTRMKAGTAQKAALNLFSTLVMIGLGRVWRGQMVDMVARNDKLRARALRMLCALTDSDDATARAALAATGMRVKPAVLVLRGLAAAQADELLARHGGHLRAALGEMQEGRPSFL